MELLPNRWGESFGGGFIVERTTSPFRRDLTEPSGADAAHRHRDRGRHEIIRSDLEDRRRVSRRCRLKHEREVGFRAGLERERKQRARQRERRASGDPREARDRERRRSDVEHLRDERRRRVVRHGAESEVRDDLDALPGGYRQLEYAPPFYICSTKCLSSRPP